MKRFSKLKNKKGFTLLETLLATAILVIIGSMLMEGFITAMGYSYNSSVYSRSAAYNSNLCVTQLSKWSMYADNVKSKSGSTLNELDPKSKFSGSSTIWQTPYADVGEYARKDSRTSNLASPQTLNFSGGGVAGYSLGKIRVAVYEKSNVAPGTADLSKFNKEKISSGLTNDAVADNRTILFYFPTNNGVYGTNNFGRTKKYMLADGSIVWGYPLLEGETDSDAINGIHVFR